MGRLAYHLASWAAAPHLERAGLAYQAPRGYIDPKATISHSALSIGVHVYITPGVCIMESDAGGGGNIG
jgi:hypothetical protein